MVVALAALSGCGTRGELGQGYFEYQCVDKSDVGCSGADISPDIPSLLAQGSRARVQYDPDGAGLFFDVTPAAPRLASVEDGAIAFHEPGEIALLAQRGGKIDDFVHVRIAVIDHLAVTGTDPLDMSVDQQAEITATPVGPSGHALSGALTYAWVSKDPLIADVVPDVASNKAQIKALTPGSTIITVSAGGVSKELTINVGGTP